MVGRHKRAALILSLIAAGVSSINAEAPQKRPDPTFPAGQKQTKREFLKFALEGVNRENRDYGACLDKARRVLLDETVKRTSFWSNLVAIGIAVCLLVVVIHQHGRQQRREVIAAELLTQYRNALSRAEAQAKDATRRNHAFMEIFNGAPEASPLDPVGARESAKRRRETAQPTAVQSPIVANAVHIGSASAQPASPAAPQTRSLQIPKATEDTAGSKQMGLFAPDGDYIAKINSLQQQLNSSQERERQLRRQLNDSELRLERERDKSRRLQP